MKRYIAQFAQPGFPELYRVVDTLEGCVVSEPKTYHEANDEAGARNDGTFGTVDYTGLAAWAAAIPAFPHS